MTTLAQITANLNAFKRAPGRTSILDRGVAATAAAHVTRVPASRTPVKIDPNAQLENEELALAALIHAELMSIKLPSVSYVQLKAKTIPCNAVGGDFFDAIALEDSLCAVVADVSGKGVPAAIVAAMLQGIIHAQMLAQQPLTAIAGMVNEFLCSRATGKFATMVLLKVNASGILEYVNCGHVPPVLINKTTVRRLDEGNVVVGLLAAAEYKSGIHELSPGDRILIFTDGITEAENSDGEQFGDLEIACCSNFSEIGSLFEQVAEFQGGMQKSDDWTLFELLYRGTESVTINPS